MHWQHFHVHVQLIVGKAAHEQISLSLACLLPLLGFPRPAAQGRGCAAEAARTSCAFAKCRRSACVEPKRQVSELRQTQLVPGAGSRQLDIGGDCTTVSTQAPAMSMFKRKKGSEPQFYATVADGLKKIYKGKLLPLEEVGSRIINADYQNHLVIARLMTSMSLSPLPSMSPTLMPGR